MCPVKTTIFLCIRKNRRLYWTHTKLWYQDLNNSVCRYSVRVPFQKLWIRIPLQVEVFWIIMQLCIQISLVVSEKEEPLSFGPIFLMLTTIILRPWDKAHNKRQYSSKAWSRVGSQSKDERLSYPYFFLWRNRDVNIESPTLRFLLTGWPKTRWVSMFSSEDSSAIPSWSSEDVMLKEISNRPRWIQKIHSFLFIRTIL